MAQQSQEAAPTFVLRASDAYALLALEAYLHQSRFESPLWWRINKKVQEFLEWQQGHWAEAPEDE